MTTRDPAELFEHAIGLPEADREAFLREACGDDRELFDDLVSLLETHSRHPDLLNTSPAPERTARTPVLDSVPQRIGPFTIGRLLGAGGMGAVFEATDTRRGDRVALKVMAAAPAALSASRQAMEREARALAGLDHPCIVPIRSVENHDGRLVLVMPVGGSDPLSERLDSGRLDPVAALRIVRRIAMAMEAAHGAGILHLDLKPANVVVGGAFGARVLDFGLARHARDDGRSDGAKGIIAGTPGYMSPEQIDGDECDHRADLFAIGAVLFECLAGRPAFRGNSPLDVLAATRNDEPDWEAVDPELADVADVGRRCLSRDPAGRPESAAEVRRVLSDAIVRLSASERSTPTRGPKVPSLPRRATNLMVGREPLRQHLLALLDDGEAITLVGSGGGGKTRLALEVAWEIAAAPRPSDRVIFVDLSPIVDAALVLRSVADAMGVSESKSRTLEESVIASLVDGETLLLLDNAEHVTSTAGPLIESFHRECPRLRTLVTSREPIGHAGEVPIRVRPLAVPSIDATVDDIVATGAARMLIARSGLDEDTARREADAVSDICRCVGGLPLAIEIVARAVRDVGLDTTANEVTGSIANRLDGTHSDLGSATDALDRVLSWSHDRLSASTVAVLRRLAVFRGSFSQSAVIDIVTGATDGVSIGDADVVPALVELVDAFLVEREPGTTGASGTDTLRYRVLVPVRAFAAQRLAAAGESERYRRRHRRWFAEFGAGIAPLLRGPEQGEWFARLDAEMDNLRAALESYGETVEIHNDEEHERALRFVAGLGQFWLVRGHWTEGRRHMERLAKRRLVSSAHANTVNWEGNFALQSGDLESASVLYERAIEEGEALDDDEIVARSLTNLGVVRLFRRELDAAEAAFRRGLEMQKCLGHVADVGTTELNLGVVAEWSGRLDEARRRYEASYETRRRLGDRAAMASSLNNLGAVAEKLDDLEGAAAFHEQALAIRREIGDRRGVGESLRNRGAVLALRGHVEDSRSAYEESLEVLREIEDMPGAAESLEALAALIVDSDPKRALVHLTEASSLRARVGTPPPPARAASIRQTEERLRTLLGDC